MIAPLRRRHRLMITVLAVGIPVVFLAALGARTPPPTTEELPSTVVDRGRVPGMAADQEISDFFSTTDGAPAVTLRLWASELVIAGLEPEAPLTAPDVLVYWSPSAEGDSTMDALPDDARLLGPLPGHGDRAFPLPTGSAEGALILYSLGWQEVVASRALADAVGATAEGGA